MLGYMALCRVEHAWDLTPSTNLTSCAAEVFSGQCNMVCLLKEAPTSFVVGHLCWDFSGLGQRVPSAGSRGLRSGFPGWPLSPRYRVCIDRLELSWGDPEVCESCSWAPCLPDGCHHPKSKGYPQRSEDGPVQFRGIVLGSPIKPTAK